MLFPVILLQYNVGYMATTFPPEWMLQSCLVLMGPQHVPPIFLQFTVLRMGCGIHANFEIMK